MKKLFLLLLSLLLILALCGCTADDSVSPDDIETTEDTSFWVGTVTNGSIVNIRISPDSDSRILDIARRGQMFLITAVTEDENWYQIFYYGDTGYISADYLFLSQWHKGNPITIGTVYNTDDEVNVRNAPDSGAEVVFSANKYEQFVVTAQNVAAGWHQIQYNEAFAYISADYLQITETTIDQALVK